MKIGFPYYFQLRYHFDTIFNYLHSRILKKIFSANEYSSVKREVQRTLAECGMEVTFNVKEIIVNGESMTGPWKSCWKKLKERLKHGMESKRKAKYREKELQNVYKPGRRM